MSESSPPRRSTLVWLHREQVEFVRSLADAANLTIIAAGSPARGSSAAVASECGGEPFDDLRAAIAETRAELVLLATASGVAQADPASDRRTLAAARARGVRIASFEPIPSSVTELASGWLRSEDGPPASDALRFIGLTRRSRPFRDAAEVFAEFGQPRVVQVEAWCRSAESSLASRLIAAIDTTLGVLGEPESIDAVYVGPALAQGVHALPGASLQDLHGDLIATLRYADGRAATIAASDAAARWNTTTTLLSEQGRLRLYDDGFEWIGPAGQKRDQLRLKKIGRGESAQAAMGVHAVADELSRLLDPSIPDDGPSNVAALLCVAQAALLSARTGQPESPATFRRVLGQSP